MSYQLIHGSAHDIPLPDKSVHSLVCSPPYYGLRAYSGEQAIEWPTVEYAPMAGLAPIRIQGCEPGCVHEWADGPRLARGGQSDFSSSTLKSDGRPEKSRVKTLMQNAKELKRESPSTAGAYCLHCSGWRGGLGLEPTIEAFIGHLILCLREWHRILRDDSCAFVNLGDSYCSTSTYNAPRSMHSVNGWKQNGKAPNAGIPSGLKPKDLMMVPSRFALAAQADGWYLRSAIVWAKGVSFIPHYAGSCMPESVLDRPTQSYEMVYMLAKSPSYFYDHIAVQEQAVSGTDLGFLRGKSFADPVNVAWHAESIKKRQDAGIDSRTAGNGTRNLRNTWAINPQPFAGAHFACWPEALVTPMIKASTSAHGVCAKCKSPWRRVVEQIGERSSHGVNKVADLAKGRRHGATSVMNTGVLPVTQTTGWTPTCQCACDEVVPATVIDPFSGSGTTGKACLKLGRKYIGVDISEQYLTELAPERMSNVQMEMAL